MKNSTLIIRSLAIVAVLAGLAHLFSSKTILKEEVIEQNSETEIMEIMESYDLSGKWKVDHLSESFAGSITYEIKYDGEEYTAYTYQYRDAEGHSESADGSKALVITSFDGDKGEGIYWIEYEGQVYDVPCKIKRVDKHTFNLSYDYYGYSDTETWKKK